MKILQEKLSRYDAPQKAKAAGVYPYFRAISSEQDTEVLMNGRKVLMFGSNSYMGLTNHPKVIEAAVGQKVSVSENENFISKAKSLVVTLPSVKVGVTEDTKSEILKTLNANLATNKIALKSDDNSKDNNILFTFEGSIKETDTVTKR